jgi:hydrogenase maturation factor
MTEIQQLKKTIADALKRVEVLEMAQAAKSAPVKWEPKGGDYYVYHAGIVVHSISSEDTRLFGSERETKEQAEHAAEWMRKFNRLKCWCEENAPGHEVNIIFDSYSANIVFSASVDVIDDLRTKIRDGVVEL